MLAAAAAAAMYEEAEPVGKAEAVSEEAVEPEDEDELDEDEDELCLMFERSWEEALPVVLR
jgi:hypothetical protein